VLPFMALERLSDCGTWRPVTYALQNPDFFRVEVYRINPKNLRRLYFRVGAWKVC
jgi:hypothetical protein